MNSIEYKKIKKASQRSAVLSLLGFVIIVFSIGYSYFKINDLEVISQRKQQEITIKKEKLENIKDEIKQYKSQTKSLTNQVQSLYITQESILDFLASVTDKESVSIIDHSVDWEKVKNEISNLPSGKRKNAILIAILLTWKDIPFVMGEESLSLGFDSPRFLKYVLSKVGINIKAKPGQRLSDAIMQSFEKVNDPKPGDLVFFKGQVGSFGFILASVGGPQIAPTGIGTLQKIAPLQIISLDNINTHSFPLKGYFRVKYPDE